MKYSFIGLISCLAIFASPESLSAFRGDSIIVTLTMPKRDIDTFPDLRVNVEISSGSKENLLIPHDDRWANIGDSTGFLCVQVQKKEGDKYKEVISPTLIDNLFLSDKVDTLKANEKHTSTFDIWSLFPFFDKGEYRVRVFCKMREYNGDNSYSNWVYFNCTKKVSRGIPARSMDGN